MLRSLSTVSTVCGPGLADPEAVSATSGLTLIAAPNYARSHQKSHLANYISGEVAGLANRTVRVVGQRALERGGLGGSRQYCKGLSDRPVLVEP